MKVKLWPRLTHQYHVTKKKQDEASRSAAFAEAADAEAAEKVNVAASKGAPATL